MKLQNLTVIFIIIILPIILMVSLYINTGIKTIKYQALYDTALLNATHDAIYAFEQNTANNKYSDNAETKRSIIKSSVKMFETSLANAAGISAYSSDEIEEYIPAIVFGMYDGFYVYAPSYNTQKGKYEHGLKNYVYYSETLDDGTIIRYSLDNYVSVTIKKDSGEYEIREGYLIDLSDLDISGDTVTYKGLTIQDETINGVSNSDAKNYYKKAEAFTKWFLNDVGMGSKATYLNIGSSNDPEDENSAFVKNKRKIIKEKLEGVLNSTITAYSNRTWGQNYKMPKLSEEDWEKIYNNISVTTFFQGKRIGLTKYNGYCVLNSTNSSEYVNPNLMYFIDNTGYYHDIRCDQCGDTLTGYKIGSFGNKKVTDSDGNVFYQYEHNELACYSCINGNINTTKSVYSYIEDTTTDDGIKKAYWTSLARERYNTAKLTDVSDTLIPETYTVTLLNDDGTPFNKIENINYNTVIDVSGEIPTKGFYYKFLGWSDGTNIYTNSITIKGNMQLTAQFEYRYMVTYYRYALSGADGFDDEEPIRNYWYSDIPDGYHFVGWKDKNSDTKYYAGQVIEKLTADLRLEPIVVKMPDINITDGTGATVTLADGKYTNKQTIRLQPNCTSEELNYIEFFVDGVNQNFKIKEYTTNSDNVQEIDIKYKFKIKNIKGDYVEESSEQEKYILVDRKAPDIEWTISDGKIYANVYDDIGIDGSVVIKYTSLITVTKEMTPGTYTIDNKQYNYFYDLVGLSSVGTRTITVTDKVGNSATVTVTE